MLRCLKPLVAVLALILLPHAGLVAGEDDHIWRAITLSDHNTRVVLLGSICLGAAAGMVGTFLVLRRRSLMGDTIGHATLPGVALAFLVMYALGQDRAPCRP